MTPKEIDEKLASVKSNPDSKSHLIPDENACKKCDILSCHYVSPAGVYEWIETEQKLIVKYENCLECGACRIACDEQELMWKYPRSTYGITYKQG